MTTDRHDTLTPVRHRARWSRALTPVLVAVVILAASCAADDPIAAVGGVDVCELRAPAGPEEASAVEGGVARIVFADEGHDPVVPPNDEGDMPHDDGDMPHDDDGDMPHDEAPHDDEGDVPHDDEAPHDDEMTAVDYVVDIEMMEFGYSCVMPTVEAGTTVEMHFTNAGSVDHEAVIGDLAAQDAAGAQMAQMAEGGSMAGDQGHAHGVPSLLLAPGESGSVTVHFDHPGEMIIGCHIPGHWEAGMRSDFAVT